MPDPVQPESVETTPREAILQQYQTLYGQPEAPVVETPAPVETPVPVVETPVVSAPPTVPPEILSGVQALQAQLTELQSRIPKPPEPPKPVEEDPMDLLRAGKYNEFVAKLTDQVKAATAPAATQDAVNQALEMFRIETQTSQFLNEIRTQNPEIAELERLGWLDGPIQQRVYAERAAGKIKTPTDYVNVFKSAVNAEVEKARNFFRATRAAGKQEALTTKQEVLRATPLVPNAVDTTRQEPHAPNTPEPVEDYFARRKAAELARKGLA